MIVHVCVRANDDILLVLFRFFQMKKKEVPKVISNAR